MAHNVKADGEGRGQGLSGGGCMVSEGVVVVAPTPLAPILGKEGVVGGTPLFGFPVLLRLFWRRMGEGWCYGLIEMGGGLNPPKADSIVPSSL